MSDDCKRCIKYTLTSRQNRWLDKIFCRIKICQECHNTRFARARDESKSGMLLSYVFNGVRRGGAQLD